ncbi:MAG: penicillin acylase family protein [Ilyomonas sp.]
MRIILFIISALITTALIVILNIQLPVNGGKTPRLGYFLSPQKGFWQNAEATNMMFDGNLHFKGLQGKTEVYFDERMVPHIYAENNRDAFFVQGYLHAKFRLWQMEFQTHAAAGRLSEIMGAESNGTDFLRIDKFFRRMGMVYGAEQSLKAMEADAETKTALDAYTAGVNNYINSLTEDEYPFEYKLLGYKPEPWTNLKCALFLMYMSYDLTGGGSDFEMTNAKTVFTRGQFEKLYPVAYDTMHPIYPSTTTVFPKPSVLPRIPSNADSLYFNYKDSADVGEQPRKPNRNNGSNNWAVDSSKTASKKPILCNDMHLDLNLPSLWYEIHISTPEYNVYGVSFPGAPSVIVGFNDSCAWGVTNAERDVKDFYEVKFRDSSMKEYWYDNEWRKSTFRDEVIKIKDKADDTERIAMTVWGPVMYDENYPDKLNTKKAYALSWTALDSNTALKTFLLLNKAKNFEDYKKALTYFVCPGQNFAFISKKGDCAIKQQAEFPAKWRRQGDFLMPGDNNDYRWQSIIPDSMNLVINNPPRGFISSANQMPYDTSYPYYQSGTFESFRNAIINHNLFEMKSITTDDMKRLQTDTHNFMAELSKPALIKYIDSSQLNEDDKKYLQLFNSWNLRDDAAEQGATIFKIWWDSLKNEMYGDELAQSNLPLPEVEDATLAQALQKDSLYEFADNINTAQKETMRDVITASFKKIIPVLKDAETSNRLAWGKFKDSGVRHLLKLAALSRLHLNAGGGDHVINAYQQYNGPSWRIIVELTDEPNAFGIYPGGQSGNPGSKYYDTFISDYVAGNYYPLHLYSKEQMQQKNKGKISFSKS